MKIKMGTLIVASLIFITDMVTFSRCSSFYMIDSLTLLSYLQILLLFPEEALKALAHHRTGIAQHRKPLAQNIIMDTTKSPWIRKRYRLRHVPHWWTTPWPFKNPLGSAQSLRLASDQSLPAPQGANLLNEAPSPFQSTLVSWVLSNWTECGFQQHIY